MSQSSLELLQRVCEAYHAVIFHRHDFGQKLGFPSSLCKAKEIAAGILGRVFERVEISEYERAIASISPPPENGLSAELLSGYCLVLIDGENQAFKTGYYYRNIEVAHKLRSIIESAQELLDSLDVADGDLSHEHVASTAAVVGQCFGWLQGVAERYFEIDCQERLRVYERRERSKGASIVNEPYTEGRQKWMKRVRELEVMKEISRTKAIELVSKESGVGKSTLWRYFTVENQIRAERSFRKGTSAESGVYQR